MLTLSGSVQRRAHGKFPSLSINRNGIIVEAHQPSVSSTKMYYQIGTLNENDVNFQEERLIVGRGKFPKVAINDDNHVIEVHEGVVTRRIYYNVGPLNNQRVKWQYKQELISPGRFPAVAVHDNRVVVTHDRAYFRYSSYYHIGTINEGGTAIEWGEKRRLFAESGVTETSITTNEDFAIAAGRGWFHIVCIVGRFQDDGARIEWIDEVSFNCIGYCPAVCLNDDGYTIMVWQSFFLRQLSYADGRIIQNEQPVMVEWQEGRNYDFGYNPTITLSPNNNQIVEEHETNIGRTLHLHAGRLIARGPRRQQDPEQRPHEPAGDEQPGGQDN